LVTEYQKLGKPLDQINLAGGYAWLIPSIDPDKTWHEAAPHVLYQLNAYAEWAAKVGWRQPWQNMPGEQIRDTQHLRELRLFMVTDVDTCIQRIREYAAEAPLRKIVRAAAFGQEVRGQHLPLVAPAVQRQERVAHLAQIDFPGPASPIVARGRTQEF
jgi:hypothetical protein